MHITEMHISKFQRELSGAWIAELQGNKFNKF